MLTSSSSPTIHPSAAQARNTASPFLSRPQYDGRLHRSLQTNAASVLSRPSLSNRPVPALPASQKTSSPSSRHLSTSEPKASTVVSSQAHPLMVDASTQYSPPDALQSTSPIKTPISKVVGLQTKDTTSASKLPDALASPGVTQGIMSSPTELPKEKHLDSSDSSTSSSKRSATEPAERDQVDGESSVEETKQVSPKRPRKAAEMKIMPMHYEKCNPRDLVILISSMLMELIRYNDAIPLRDGHLTRFHSRAPPGISVQDYLQRLTTHATLPPPILLSMVYYIDRLCALYPAFTISSLTVHRFLITAATVASKGLSDSFWTNKTYARVGGVSLKELALLELEFLARVEWRIVPRAEVLVDYYRSLVEREPLFQMEIEGDVSGNHELPQPDADG